MKNELSGNIKKINSSKDQCSKMVHFRKRKNKHVPAKRFRKQPFLNGYTK